MSGNHENPPIFKILTPVAWAAAEREGVVRPDGADARDGFVHLSAGPQLAGTLARYFADETAVVLVAFTAEALGRALRFEPSTGGALFPHLYGVLRADKAVGVWRLERGADGAFVLPADIA